MSNTAFVSDVTVIDSSPEGTALWGRSLCASSGGTTGTLSAK